jgi:hypothetical protein
MLAGWERGRVRSRGMRGTGGDWGERPGILRREKRGLKPAAPNRQDMGFHGIGTSRNITILGLVVGESTFERSTTMT